jgi:small redox-active disulfide protein 2
MKSIKILGMGCPTCQKLAERAETAARELGVEYEIEKVDKIDQIMEFGVMVTPALVVDGEVKVSGKVPSMEEAKEMIQ